MLAFALLTPARGGDPVAYEVLNLPEPVTYVYRAGGPDPRALVNQALDDAGFATAEIHAAASGDLAAAHRQDAATAIHFFFWFLTKNLISTTWVHPKGARLVSLRGVAAAWLARLYGGREGRHGFKSGRPD